MAIAKELSIYLQDHLAGAAAGLDLARRTAKANEGTRYGEPLRRIAEEIREDREALRRIAESLGASRNLLKEAGGRLGERAGRLKLNGRLIGYSPLSRLIELEGLVLGVTGKRSLWVALKEAGVVEDATLDPLIERADAQREELERLRRSAATEALSAAQPEPDRRRTPVTNPS